MKDMASTVVEGEDKVLATAPLIGQSLTHASDPDDMVKIFSEFDNRLSALSSFFDRGNTDSPNISSTAIFGDHSSAVSDEYYSVVDGITNFMDELDLIELPDDAADRMHSAIQLAMKRLEEEFRHILIRSTVPFDQDGLSNGEEGSESIGDVSIRSYSSSGDSFCGDELAILSVHPAAVDELRGIAGRMMGAGYEKECCRAYCSVRCDVLDDCMAILGVEKLSVEDVRRVSWDSLEGKMRKWVHAVKIVVGKLLPSEKRLCEQIFAESESIKEVCFLETSKCCVMHLLNFAEAVAMGRRAAEKLFRILDMYDALARVLPNLQDLFVGEDAGDVVCNEAKGVLKKLGEASVGTFLEFENTVKGESSKKPMQKGEIHPLARYVMNYAVMLVDYFGTFNSLLENDEAGPGEAETAATDFGREESMSPIARCLLSLITSLESNLEEKSKAYDDIAMQYIFRMNNALYIAIKVKDTKLGNLLGGNWVEKRMGLVRQFANGYFRNSWTNALDFLKDEGIGGSLKDRLNNFNARFEEIYMVQTAWKVPDHHLREELRISNCRKVIPTYRSFLGRLGSHHESGMHAEKYVKYTPEDLEDYLLHLFEGTALTLHHLRKKGT